MKKFSPITIIIFLVLTGFTGEIYSQSKSVNKLKNQVEASLEISCDNNTGATVVYTRPNRSLNTPEIQMIAQFISQDSINSYQFRIEIFTQRKVLKSEKIFIKSSSGKHVFYAQKENVKSVSRIIDELINWGNCFQYGCTAEGYIHTFILKTSRENFIKIISSNELKVFISNMGIPDEQIKDSDISKMNDLYTYLKVIQKNDLLNL
jgi:hypothetical protein